MSQDALPDMPTGEGEPEYLRLLRQARLNVSGVSGRDIAIRAGCSPANFYNVLKGQYGASPEMLRRIAGALTPEGGDLYQEIIAAHDTFRRDRTAEQLRGEGPYDWPDHKKKRTPSTHAVVELTDAVKDLTTAVRELTAAVNSPADE